MKCMKRDEQMTDESAESEYEKSQRVYEQCQLRILLEIDVLQFSVAVRQTKTCFHMYPPFYRTVFWIFAQCPDVP